MIKWFEIQNAREKIRALPQALDEALNLTRIERHEMPSSSIGRDVTVLPVKQLSPKIGLGLIEGQARLLHDLANIELQAMELGVRTLTEFPDAPHAFRQELADITLGEGRHLGLCLDGIERLGFEWGRWAVHSSLLDAVSHTDSLLDRILIVHRYLEGSGIDAGESILTRLTGARCEVARPIVSLITKEEVDHVKFGSFWYHSLCRDQKIDASKDFAKRMPEISRAVPRRERIAVEARKRAGFTDEEIACLEKIQERFLKSNG